MNIQFWSVIFPAILLFIFQNPVPGLARLPFSAEEVMASIVTLRVHGEGGEVEREGSGFFVSGSRVVTNVHVVQGASWVEIVGPDGEYLGSAPFAAALDLSNDLAVLHIPGNGSRPLRLAWREPEIGEEVWAFGSPLGLEGTVTNGIIASHRDLDGRHFLQISAPISHGSSGGPVVNSAGEVVGVVSAFIQGGQNLNFAVPVDYLLALLGNQNSRIPFPEVEAEKMDEDLYLAVNIIRGFTLADSISFSGYYPGILESSDIDVGGPCDFFKFAGRRGQRVQIDVLSDTFDPMVELIHLEGFMEEDGWSVSDDDGGDGTAARIATSLPSPGTYIVAVRGYGSSMGTYQLRFGDADSGARGHHVDSRWVEVAFTDEATFFVDSRAMASTYNGVKGWILTIWNDVQAFDDGDRYDARMEKWECDCSDRTYQVTSYSYRFGDEGVNSQEVPLFRRTSSSVFPGTVGEAILDYMCENR